MYLIFRLKSEGKWFKSCALWFQTSRPLTLCFSAMRVASLKTISCCKTVLFFQLPLLSFCWQEGGRESGRSCLLPVRTLPKVASNNLPYILSFQISVILACISSSVPRKCSPYSGLPGTQLNIRFLLL